MSANLAADVIEALRHPAPDVTRLAEQPTLRRNGIDGPVIRADNDGKPPGRTVLQALTHRSSTRFFGAEPVAIEQLADVLDCGLASDADAWPGEVPDTFEATVLAFRVRGLAPGIYRYERPARSYGLVAPLPTEEKLFDLTLQREFCHSAAIVSLGANLHDVSVRRGAHGYRMLMGRAGATAYTMWLNAVAHGLVGSVFAGFIPASVRRPLQSDGAARHQMFALALGAPTALSRT